jgi:hypothetical protein
MSFDFFIDSRLSTVYSMSARHIPSSEGVDAMTELPGVDIEELRRRKAELQEELQAIAQIERVYARLQARGTRGAAGAPKRVAGREPGRPTERLAQVVSALKEAGKPLSPSEIHLRMQQQGAQVAWADAGKSMTELARRDRKDQGLLVKHPGGTYGLAEWGAEAGPPE